MALATRIAIVVFLLAAVAYADMPSSVTLENVNYSKYKFKDTTIGEFKLAVSVNDYNLIYPQFTQHYYLAKISNNNQLTSKSVPSFTNSLTFSENLMKGRFVFYNAVEKKNADGSSNFELTEGKPSTISAKGDQWAAFGFQTDTWKQGWFNISFDFAGLGSAFIDPNLVACGTIGASGHYDMTGDIKISGGVPWVAGVQSYCITIPLSDVEIDGHGYGIIANGTDIDDYLAFWMASPANAWRQNINISNIYLRGFNNPIISAVRANIRFTNLSIEDNQSSHPPPDMAACQYYYGCITTWSNDNITITNVNCTQTNTCGKGFMINQPLLSTTQRANLTMSNIRINSTNTTGIKVWNTNNITIQDVNMTDLNVSGIELLQCNNFSINRVNMSFMTNQYTLQKNSRAAMMFNESNGTVNNFLFSLSDANMKVIHLVNNSRVSIENSTIISQTSTLNASVNVSDSAVLNLTNFTFQCSNCFDVSNPRAMLTGANLTLKQYVRVFVRDVHDVGIDSATVTIYSNNSMPTGVPLSTTLTTSGGVTSYYAATEVVMNRTYAYWLNNYTINVSRAGYTDYSGVFNLSNGTAHDIYINLDFAVPSGGGGTSGVVIPTGNVSGVACSDGTLDGQCSRNQRCTLPTEGAFCVSYRCVNSSLVEDQTCNSTYQPPAPIPQDDWLTKISGFFLWIQNKATEKFDYSGTKIANASLLAGVGLIAGFWCVTRPEKRRLGFLILTLCVTIITIFQAEIGLTTLVSGLILPLRGEKEGHERRINASYTRKREAWWQPRRNEQRGSERRA